jgi:hypothetical protein
MISSLLKNKFFYLTLLVSLVISAVLSKMPDGIFAEASTLLGVLFGGAFTGVAVVVSLISEDGLRRIYERKKDSYDRVLADMRASLILLLCLVLGVILASFFPLSGHVIIGMDKWQLVIEMWRMPLFLVLTFIGLGIFSVNEILQAVIGLARIRFELAGSKNQTERKTETGLTRAD